MPRRIEYMSVTVIYSRDGDGNVVKSLSPVVFVTRDPSPAPGAKQYEKQDFKGHADPITWDGTMKLNELIDAMKTIAQSEGNAV
jgi:hypothetical protein